MPVRTAGLAYMHLHVADIETAVAFCQAAFGAKEEFRVADRLVLLRLNGGEIVRLDGRLDQRTPDYFGLRLASGEDLGSALGEIVRARGTVVERGEHAPGVAYAYVSDPDGNGFEL